jgi:hypothetical protein
MQPSVIHSNETNIAVFEKLLSLFPHADLDHRPIVCTPIYAGYDTTPTGWLLSILGSPPRGHILIETPNGGRGTARIISGTFTKQLHGKSLNIAHGFLALIDRGA